MSYENNQNNQNSEQNSDLKNTQRNYQSKGTLPVENLDVSLSDDKNPYLIAEKSEQKAKEKTTRRLKAVIIVSCIAASLGLNFLSFGMPYAPSIITVDFSAFPELFAGLVINPIAAIIVIIVKNLIYFAIRFSASPTIFASVVNKVIVDIIYVLAGIVLYRAIMRLTYVRKKIYKNKIKSKSTLIIETVVVLVAGIIASLIVAPVSVLSFTKILLPLLGRILGSGSRIIYAQYFRALANLIEQFPSIRNITKDMNYFRAGLLVFNLPLYALKYVVCSLLSTIAFLLFKDLSKNNSN
ncbi:MAG: hypothetical protein IJ731_00965 [Eubacterium sp.]|nr:hypothetical protein [Eubacterium sp.]